MKTILYKKLEAKHLGYSCILKVSYIENIEKYLLEEIKYSSFLKQPYFGENMHPRTYSHEKAGNNRD